MTNETLLDIHFPIPPPTHILWHKKNQFIHITTGHVLVRRVLGLNPIIRRFDLLHSFILFYAAPLHTTE